MIKLPVIHIDCNHFFGDRPCLPNKKYGVFCHDCPYYEKEEDPSDETDSKLTLRPTHSIIDYPKDFVIIKLDAVGDVLRTTSILPSLKFRYPISSITWITKERSDPVLKDNELINNIITVESDEFKKFLKEHEPFDIAINLDSGIESCRIMKHIKAAVSFGYVIKNGKPWPVNELANEWYLMGINDNVKKKNMKTYHMIIHEICGITYKNTKPSLVLSNEIKKIMEQFLNKLSDKKYDEMILVNLGGGNRWQNKKWTKEGYSSLINEISEKYKNKIIGIIAGEEDKDFYNEVAKLINTGNNIVNYGCENSKEEFIAVISISDKIVTSDSLGMHIATALDKYTVVLVGPTSYDELDVFDNGKIIHSSIMECKCYYSAVCTEEVNCMNTITTEKVIKALEL